MELSIIVTIIVVSSNFAFLVFSYNRHATRSKKNHHLLVSQVVPRHGAIQITINASTLIPANQKAKDHAAEIITYRTEYITILWENKTEETLDTAFYVDHDKRTLARKLQLSPNHYLFNNRITIVKPHGQHSRNVLIFFG